MKLNELDTKGLKAELLSLMDKVVVLLDNEPNVDKFLDETDLFDAWELVLPEAEYPIFIMAVLNNIRKPVIIDSIIKAITNERIHKDLYPESKTKKVETRSHVGEHPFS